LALFHHFIIFSQVAPYQILTKIQKQPCSTKSELARGNQQHHVFKNKEINQGRISRTLLWSCNIWN